MLFLGWFTFFLLSSIFRISFELTLHLLSWITKVCTPKYYPYPLSAYLNYSLAWILEVVSSPGEDLSSISFLEYGVKLSLESSVLGVVPFLVLDSSKFQLTLNLYSVGIFLFLNTMLLYHFIQFYFWTLNKLLQRRLVILGVLPPVSYLLSDHISGKSAWTDW